MIVLLLFVTIAVALFISSGRKTAVYDFLEKEIFETEYGVSGMVLRRKEKYSKIYTKNNIIGAGLCIMALIPLLGGAIFNDENVLLLTIMLSASFVLAGIGVIFLLAAVLYGQVMKNLYKRAIIQRKKREINLLQLLSWVQIC